jgi:hypothetical protein
VKNEEILRWVASHWHELERQVNRSHRILVADDEEDVRQVGAETLGRFAHKTEQPRRTHPPEKLFRATAVIA